MIYIKYNGRFGNNLFQYAMGRILAEQYGHGLGSYKGENSVSLLNCQRALQDKYSWTGPFITLSGNRVELTAVPSGSIYLDGTFQRAEYYIQHRDKIKKWFEVPEIEFRPKNEDVVLHIRRSDFGYKHNGGMLPLDYYGDILDNNEFGQVYITGGCSHFGEKKDIDDQVKEYFQKYKPLYITSDAIKTFRAIQKFKNVVQSMSTFCWWASFLSDEAERIYTPITNDGYWQKNGDINLMINNDVYVYVDNLKVEKF